MRTILRIQREMSGVPRVLIMPPRDELLRAIDRADKSAFILAYRGKRKEPVFLANVLRGFYRVRGQKRAMSDQY